MTDDLNEFYSLGSEAQEILRFIAANGGTYVDDDGTEYKMSGKAWDVLLAEIEAGLEE